MSGHDFDAYVLEYQAEGIGTLLYTFIRDIVIRTTRHYPAIVYSQNGIWDEDATCGLCHDFAIEKLIKSGWLEHYLISLENIDQLQHALQRDFRHFLINQRRKDEFQNLVHRLRRILTTKPAFKEFSSAKRAHIWGLSEWEEEDPVQQIDMVVEAMYKVVLPPLTRYSMTSRKVSHLISNEDLERLIIEMLDQLNQCVSFDLMVQAMRYRLNLLEIDPISLDQPLDRYSDDSDTYAEIIASPIVNDELELTEIAHHIFSQLTQRQKHTLSVYLSLEKPTLEKVGKEIGISKSVVNNDLDAIERYVASAEVTEEQAERLFAYLSELCAEQA